jgi:ferric-dicitrate binding protein FerR (iron transport regulator)
MSIKCPTAVISVRGTEFAVEAGSAAASVGVFSGEVAVSSASEKSGEELEAAASTEAVTAPSLAEVSVKPGEETTIDKGESPKPPTRLSLLMQKNAARMNELRGRAQELREKLKRVKPEYLDKLRQETLDRVTNINEKRNQLRERIKEQREQVK